MYYHFTDLIQVSHTELEEHLRSYGVTDCYVTGIATDVCVNATASHSIEIGFRTILVNDAYRYGKVLQDFPLTVTPVTVTPVTVTQ